MEHGTWNMEWHTPNRNRDRERKKKKQKTAYKTPFHTKPRRPSDKNSTQTGNVKQKLTMYINEGQRDDSRI